MLSYADRRARFVAADEMSRDDVAILNLSDMLDDGSESGGDEEEQDDADGAGCDPQWAAASAAEFVRGLAALAGHERFAALCTEHLHSADEQAVWQAVAARPAGA